MRNIHLPGRYLVHLLTPRIRLDVGYIGGSVLWRLLQHKDAADFKLTVLVRSAEKAKLFKEKFGIDATVGSYEEEDKLEALAAEADYVIATVSHDPMTLFLDLFTDQRR